jgi:short subunit dehydrogenase-like uncharacterized protein
MSGAQSWMLYGAAGHTGALIAQHARKRGHQPMLAGRNAAAVAALAERASCLPNWPAPAHPPGRSTGRPKPAGRRSRGT